MKTNRPWMAVGLLTAVQFFGKCKKTTREIALIYGASAYLKGVQLLREFFLYQISILACVMLVVLGVLLMEAAVIFYLPWQTPARAILAFVFGGLNILTGVFILTACVSSERWLQKASKYNTLLKASLEADKG